MLIEARGSTGENPNIRWWGLSRKGPEHENQTFWPKSHCCEHSIAQLLTTYSRVQTDVNIFLSQLLKPDSLKKVFFFRTQFICLIIFLIIKKLKIKKTKPFFIISVLKVECCVGLVFSNSDFFINKISQANKLSVI